MADSCYFRSVRLEGCRSQDCEDAEALRVVVLPELTFGIDDWQAIDELVSKYPRKLLVSSGFGFTQAAVLRGRAAFVADNVSDGRKVNYGSIWISQKVAGDGGCKQEFFCKNFAEQSVEAPGFDPLLGDEIVVLEFDDLLVAPLICADLLEDTKEKKTNALDRLRDERKKAEGKSLLILVSVRQAKPWHPIWASKMDRAVDTPCVLVLANAADSDRPPSFPADSRRNLSGVYTCVSNHKDCPDWSVWSSAVHEATLTGQPLRDVPAMAVAGPLQMNDFSPTLGRHLWMPRWGKRLGESGNLSDGPNHAVLYEIPRLLHRARHAAPSDKEALHLAAAHLGKATEARVIGLVAGILHGPFDTKGIAPKVSWTSTRNANGESGLRLADALNRGGDFKWPDAGHVTLRYASDLVGTGATEIPVFIWISDSHDANTMTRLLADYAQNTEALPALVVFGSDKENTPVDRFEIRRPRDISGPADVDSMDVGTPRATPNIVAVINYGEAMQISARFSITDKFVATYQRIVLDIRAQLLAKD